ncbi:MAG: 5'-deoxyadenosine deaminase [Verrucomicrobiae bacterium]|nr:5'-deoxyadenosine deaminase [Verrucomicrobiae bacterium]
MILRAKWVLPVSAPPIENGAVTVEGDSIVAVGPATGEGRDLGEVVLAPGLINAHCHFDYSHLQGKVPFHGSFADWLMLLVELKKQQTEADYLAGIQAGIEQALAAGTTTVVNIASVPNLIPQLPATPLKIIWCEELIDLFREEPAEKLVEAALQRPGIGGLSPHAPYTASPELYRLAARHARGRHWVFTTHLAESEEEDDMFRRGTGHMYDSFRRAGRDMADCKRVGPVQLLRECEVLTPECLVAHANCLTELDMMLLQATGTPVAHCPQTHRFFRRGMPLIERLQHAGVNVCLGSDSLASGESLSMFAQMQELSREFPRWSAEQILPLATTNAAKALQRAGKLGEISVGAVADLIAVPLAGNFDPYEAVVFAEQPVSFMMINGNVVRE